MKVYSFVSQLVLLGSDVKGCYDGVDMLLGPGRQDLQPSRD
jgi:hypothetical protein